MKAESAGTLDMDVDTPLLTGVKAHHIQLTSTDGVANDTIYHFGVRACDANNNCDTNTETVSATPTAEPLVSKENFIYRTNDTAGQLIQNGSYGSSGQTGVTLSSARIFAPTANITYSVKYYRITSYNVCYTKLLRSPVKSVTMPMPVPGPMPAISTAS